MKRTRIQIAVTADHRTWGEVLRSQLSESLTSRSSGRLSQLSDGQSVSGNCSGTTRFTRCEIDRLGLGAIHQPWMRRCWGQR